MKKTIGLIIMLLIILITLTGCVNVDYEVKVNKDGSGDISYIYGFSKETLESLQVSAEDMVESMKEQAEESLYTVEAYEDEKIAGFKAIKHINDLTKDFSLQEAFTENYVKDNENNGIKIEKSLFITKYSQNAEIDLTSMEELGENVKMTYKVNLPGKVKSTNATKISENDKELTWELKGGKINKIEFVAQTINILPIVIITVFILAVSACVIIIFLVLKKKHATKNENNI